MTRSTSTPSTAPVESRTYRDAETGVSVTVPGGFTFTEPTAENTRMSAAAPMVDGITDNINLKIVPADLPELAAIQSPMFIAKVAEALCGQGASHITAAPATVAGSPAVSVGYEIGATPVYGVQINVARDGHVLILTVTADTPERAFAIADAIDVKAAA